MAPASGGARPRRCRSRRPRRRGPARTGSRAAASAWRSSTAPARVEEIDAPVRGGADHQRARGGGGRHDGPARRRLEARLARGERRGRAGGLRGSRARRRRRPGRRTNTRRGRSRALQASVPSAMRTRGHAAVEGAHDRASRRRRTEWPAPCAPSLADQTTAAGGGVERVQRAVVASAQDAPGRRGRRGEDGAELARPDRLALRVHGDDRARALRVHDAHHDAVRDRERRRAHEAAELRAIALGAGGHVDADEHRLRRSPRAATPSARVGRALAGTDGDGVEDAARARGR